MKKQTANEVIQDALDYRYNEERRSKLDTIGKILDFSDWGKKYRRKGNNCALLYLGGRFMEQQKIAEEAKEREENTYRIAKQSVEMFGLEALKMFQKNYDLLKRK